METESQAEFASIVNDMKRNAFVDTTADAALGKSLKENLQGPQGEQGPVGPKGLSGPQVSPASHAPE